MPNLATAPLSRAELEKKRLNRWKSQLESLVQLINDCLVESDNSEVRVDLKDFKFLPSFICTRLQEMFGLMYEIRYVKPKHSGSYSIDTHHLLVILKDPESGGSPLQNYYESPQ